MYITRRVLRSLFVVVCCRRALTFFVFCVVHVRLSPFVRNDSVDLLLCETTHLIPQIESYFRGNRLLRLRNLCRARPHHPSTLFREFCTGTTLIFLIKMKRLGIAECFGAPKPGVMTNALVPKAAVLIKSLLLIILIPPLKVYGK